MNSDKTANPDGLAEYCRGAYERALIQHLCRGGISIGGGVTMRFGDPPSEVDTIEKAFDWIEGQMWGCPSNAGASPSETAETFAGTIASVFLFPNQMVAVTNTKGEQMPAYNGVFSLALRESIERDAPAVTRWYGWPGKPEARAFTLLELLVVVAVVAALVALFGPGLSGAMRGVRSVKCQSNLRQIGTLFNLYRLANKDRLPDRGWDCLELEAFETNRINHCPEDERESGGNFSWYPLVDQIQVFGRPPYHWGAVIDKDPPNTVPVAADYLYWHSHRRNVGFLDGHAAVDAAGRVSVGG